MHFMITALCHTLIDHVDFNCLLLITRKCCVDLSSQSYTKLPYQEIIFAFKSFLYRASQLVSTGPSAIKPTPNTKQNSATLVTQIARPVRRLPQALVRWLQPNPAQPPQQVPLNQTRLAPKVLARWVFIWSTFCSMAVCQKSLQHLVF